MGNILVFHHYTFTITLSILQITLSNITDNPIVKTKHKTTKATVLKVTLLK